MGAYPRRDESLFGSNLLSSFAEWTPDVHLCPFSGLREDKMLHAGKQLRGN